MFLKKILTRRTNRCFCDATSGCMGENKGGGGKEKALVVLLLLPPLPHCDTVSVQHEAKSRIFSAQLLFFPSFKATLFYG